MIKLLNAGFERLRKNKIFWLFLLFSIGFALFLIYAQYSDMKRYEETAEVELLLLNYSTMIGIVISIFISLFLGVEYSDGAIRNKISIGHKRINIYLSNLIIVTITSLFAYIVYLLVVTSIAIPLFGSITISVSALMKLLGCVFLAIMAYCSIFTFIAMTISNKTITAIVSIMTTFAFMMIALTCFNILSAPEYIQSGSLVNGEIKFEEVRNPEYPSEEKKKVCQTLIDIIPAGQMFQLGGRSVPNLKVLPIYSLGEVVIFAGAGILLFNKKELK